MNLKWIENDAELFEELCKAYDYASKIAPQVRYRKDILTLNTAIIDECIFNFAIEDVMIDAVNGEVNGFVLGE